MVFSCKRGYHHGNLKTALIKAAMKQLQEDSLESLSLRGLARSVGVTPTAAYNHFADKTALLVDLKSAALSQFDSFLADALKDIPADQPEQRIRAMAHAYLAFSSVHPALFNLVFNWVPDLERLTEEFMVAGGRGEELLREEIVGFLQQQGQQPDDYQAAIASLSAWSMVHGITTLLKSSTVEAIIYCHNWPEDLNARDCDGCYRMLDHLVDLTLAGLRTGIPLIERHPPSPA
ncbi:TetR/AcrR family transcriptional regulator [Natronospirillum operosum]|uniref:TetR/AcrR family transcriptional regulator n=1 Tax=Natronospirillum operosum TaxID=2759953 RepID=A0A4Z0W6R8_9GAMM|nr:TetR/AcrR family transcriptional regulator [Natronospirillum operosum]TGG90740.1 TetR/AcrR family transcriptional regulator [Natronospirillum operosum]